MSAELDSQSIEKSNQRAAFASVTTLFFAWGFITVTVDPLIATLKAIYKLSFAEVMLTQFSFFMAYGIVSLPAAPHAGSRSSRIAGSL
jgi:FHS family L-fucose permease-like MFS transporter